MGREDDVVSCPLVMAADTDRVSPPTGRRCHLLPTPGRERRSAAGDDFYTSSSQSQRARICDCEQRADEDAVRAAQVPPPAWWASAAALGWAGLPRLRWVLLPIGPAG